MSSLFSVRKGSGNRDPNAGSPTVEGIKGRISVIVFADETLQASWRRPWAEHQDGRETPHRLKE